MRLLAALLCCLILSTAPVLFAEDGAASSSDSAGAVAANLQDLKKAIPYGVSLLEKQDYQTFLKTFVEPEQLAKQTKNKSFEEFAKSFAGKKSDALLAVLKAAKDLEPKFDKSGDTAIFTIPEEAAKAANISRREIAFGRIEKRWYIKN